MIRWLGSLAVLLLTATTAAPAAAVDGSVANGRPSARPESVHLTVVEVGASAPVASEVTSSNELSARVGSAPGTLEGNSGSSHAPFFSAHRDRATLRHAGSQAAGGSDSPRDGGASTRNGAISSFGTSLPPPPIV